MLTAIVCHLKVYYHPKGGGVEEEVHPVIATTGCSSILSMDLVIGRIGGSVMVEAMGGVCCWIRGSV